MQSRITSVIICVFLSIVLSGFSFNLLAKVGGSCDYAEEDVLVQIKATNENEYILSTLGIKRSLEPSTSERLFYVSTSQVKEHISKSDYLLATIKHIISGTCTPQYVVRVEKLSIDCGFKIRI